MKIYNKILIFIFSSFFDDIEPALKEPFAPKGNKRIKTILGVFYIDLKNLFQFSFKKGNNVINNKNWFFFDTKNQLDSLYPVHLRTSNSALVSLQEQNYNCDYYTLRTPLKFLFYFKFLFVFTNLFLVHRKKAIEFLPVILSTIGFYEEFLRLLKKHKPKSVIFSNDHSPRVRALLFAAKKLKITTVYIQHASVSDYFPALEFDVNLLEGKDSLTKYEKKGKISGEIHLIGMPKFDEYFHKRKKRREIKNIGICTNLIDDPSEVLYLLNSLNERFPHLSFSLRNHPQENRIQLKNAKNIEISDATKTKIFDFLIEQDLIISGNSSVHLEAVLLNIPSIYYEMNNYKVPDYYGYVSKSLILQAKNINELFQLIEAEMESREDVYIRAKNFNEIVGTKWEGKSALLIHKTIADKIK